VNKKQGLKQLQLLPLGLDALHGYGAVLFLDFYAYPPALEAFTGDGGCTGAKEGVKY
jgi:hypothetical protein